MAYANGAIPESQLVTIPGGKLPKDAARAWLAMRYYIGRKTNGNVWLRPGGPNSSYRPLSVQRRFWAEHQAGRMPQAVARPGTSNHGNARGAVDLATPAMAAAVARYGWRFGFGIASSRHLLSDANGEWWHTARMNSGNKAWVTLWYGRYRVAKRAKRRA